MHISEGKVCRGNGRCKGPEVACIWHVEEIPRRPVCLEWGERGALLKSQRVDEKGRPPGPQRAGGPHFSTVDI